MTDQAESPKQVESPKLKRVHISCRAVDPRTGKKTSCQGTEAEIIHQDVNQEPKMGIVLSRRIHYRCLTCEKTFVVQF